MMIMETAVDKVPRFKIIVANSAGGLGFGLLVSDVPMMKVFEKRSVDGKAM